jgi:predicted Zn-dependent peptidase
MPVDQALYRRTVLPNGLTVLTEPMDHIRTAAVGVWVNAGSRYEDGAHNGVSHFIEHVLFKGTATRSALEIAQAMDAIGGHLNAFTEKEHTCFYLRVLSDHLEEGLEILADMLLRPALEPAALERERQVILEEIKMYEDAPDDLVHDLFAATLWPGHPLGRSISGSQESVSRLRREDLLGFMAARYRPDASLVTAAGRLEHGQITALVERMVDGWVGRSIPVSLAHPTSRRATAILAKDIEQVHLCIGVPCLPQAHPDWYVLSVLDTALGGGMSSRLFQEIREERGLVLHYLLLRRLPRCGGVRDLRGHEPGGQPRSGAADPGGPPPSPPGVRRGGDRAGQGVAQGEPHAGPRDAREPDDQAGQIGAVFRAPDHAG